MAPNSYHNSNIHFIPNMHTMRKGPGKIRKCNSLCKSSKPTPIKYTRKGLGLIGSNFTILSTFQISSTETETEDEDMMPDLDGRRSAAAAAAMAAHAQEEAALATSSDSLASLIPPEKKQSMQGRYSFS